MKLLHHEVIFHSSQISVLLNCHWRLYRLLRFPSLHRHILSCLPYVIQQRCPQHFLSVAFSKCRWRSRFKKSSLKLINIVIRSI
jgi:hypothetical protein